MDTVPVKVRVKPRKSSIPVPVPSSSPAGWRGWGAVGIGLALLTAVGAVAYFSSRPSRIAAKEAAVTPPVAVAETPAVTPAVTPPAAVAEAPAVTPAVTPPATVAKTSSVTPPVVVAEKPSVARSVTHPVAAATTPIVATTETPVIGGDLRINGNVFWADAVAGQRYGDDMTRGEVGANFPLQGEHLRMQLGGMIGRASDDDLLGAEAHLLFADRKMGLVGLTALYEDLGGLHVERYGTEGELYLGDWSLRGTVGFQGGSMDNAAYGSVGVGYYVNANAFVEVAMENVDGIWLEKISGEFALPWQSMRSFSLLAEGVLGEDIHNDWSDGQDNYNHWFVGIRYYFDGDGNLRDRRRGLVPSSQVLDCFGDKSWR